MTLAASIDKSLKSFDELMCTPIDFFAYIMNGLKITNLTQETLLGTAFKLLKGTRSNYAELEYDFEEWLGIKTWCIFYETYSGSNLGRGDGVSDFAIALRMFTRSLVIQNQVKDLQLGVESYQKKINVTKPKSTRPGLRKRDSFTLYQDPQGVIYVNNQERNMLMRSDELYKFNDGTLTRLLSSLEDITNNITMEYLPKRR
ncbi:hypothetical protein Tco_0072904 [Tanacetum coccineum]